MGTAVDSIDIHISPAPGRAKIAVLPIDGEITMGMHGRVAEHYGVSVADFEPHATSLDYLVAAIGSCLTGTLSGMLGRLGQSTTTGELQSRATGRLCKERGVLYVDSVEMTYLLRLTAGVEASAVRAAHARHLSHCPVARSITGSITISTTLTFTNED